MCSQNVSAGKSKQNQAAFFACCKNGQVTRYDLRRQGDGKLSEILLIKDKTYNLFSEQINCMQIVDSTRYIFGLEKSGVFHVKGTTELKIK